MDTAGKACIVTGGAWGIGRATVLRLAAEGARVVATDLDGEREGLDEVATLGGGAVVPCLADVASEQDWPRVVDLAELELGGVDILVNNAGGHTPPNFPDTPPARWAQVLDVNLKGVMLGIQAVLPALRRRGGGAVVNVSSVAGFCASRTRRPNTPLRRPA